MTELLITVTVTYGGDKARSLVPRCTSQRDVVETLRTDFTAMGVPHPKAESIVLHSIGRITCSWRTQDTNLIRKKLRQITREQNTEPLYGIKEQQSIESVDTTEETVFPDRGPFYSPYSTMDYREQTRPFQHNGIPPARGPHISSPAMVFGNPRKERGSPASSSDPTTSSASEAQSALPPVAQGYFKDTSNVDQLTRELRQIREYIATAKTIEKGLLDHLKRLVPPAVTEPQMEIDGLDKGSSLTTRLEVAERSLQTARKGRIEAEQALQDVERERKEPFIVPALLKAFIDISRLTTELSNVGRQNE